MRIEFFSFKKEVVALLITMSKKDLLKGGNSKIFNTHRSKRNVVVQDLRLSCNNTMRHHGVSDFLYVRDSVYVYSKDSLQNL